jgi:hypothetical protein
MDPERLARKLVDAVAERVPWAEVATGDDDEELAAALRH